MTTAQKDAIELFIRKSLNIDRVSTTFISGISVKRDIQVPTLSGGRGQIPGFLKCGSLVNLLSKYPV